MAMNIHFDPYSILGISRNANADDIKRAHRRLAQRLHPDTNPHHPGAGEQFQDITLARDLLLDPDMRRQYDDEANRRQSGGDLYFTLRVTPSRRAVLQLPEEQIIYLLAEISASPGASDTPKQETRLNLTLVLDHSNSMKGQRMERVKGAAVRLIDDMRPGDILSVIAFNDRATVIIPATTIDDKARLKARVSVISPAGGTEIYQGLRAGYDEAKKYLGPRMINHMILLTDGHTYGDQDNCLELAKTAAGEGIAISAMGLGHDWNDDFLDRLASSTGGSSLFINSAEVVMRFFREHVKALSNAFAERMFLSVAPDPDVHLEMAFQLSPNPQPLVIDDGRIPLASLQPNRAIAILLQFQLPAGMNDGFRTVARLVGGGDILHNQQQAFRAVSDVSLEVTEKPAREEPPPAIMDALSKLTLYRLQERARDAVDRGDVQEATRRLENLATRLLEMGEDNLAQQTMSEAKYIAQTQALSDRGRKTIKYQTRALMDSGGLQAALSSLLTAPPDSQS
ncbi:MAG: VWA domain-containing protein [Anaerolineae bacterium]|jgi:Ca-activated chloride channel family protein|nr:VWA domain-containing protein [Anaerolineae bacterium]